MSLFKKEVDLKSIFKIVKQFLSMSKEDEDLKYILETFKDYMKKLTDYNGIFVKNLYDGYIKAGFNEELSLSLTINHKSFIELFDKAVK